MFSVQFLRGGDGAEPTVIGQFSVDADSVQSVMRDLALMPWPRGADAVRILDAHGQQALLRMFGDSAWRVQGDNPGGTA